MMGFLSPTAHEALQERWPLSVDPRNPSGGPGTIPICPETFRCPHDNFPYINLYLWTLPELLVTSGIPSGTRTTFGSHILVFLITLASPNLKCVDPTGSGDTQT